MRKTILTKWKDERAKMRERFEDGKGDAPRCKKFGCGKILTPTEFLYGEYCFPHAQEKIKYERH